jgi:hypothetical protein
MEKVKKRHPQMTNTAKQQGSLGIYDNNKPGTNRLFDKVSCLVPPARNTVHEIPLEIEEWLHTLHTSVRGQCV